MFMFTGMPLSIVALKSDTATLSRGTAVLTRDIKHQHVQKAVNHVGLLANDGDNTPPVVQLVVQLSQLFKHDERYSNANRYLFNGTINSFCSVVKDFIV